MSIIGVAVLNRYRAKSGYVKLYLANHKVVEEHRYAVANHLGRDLDVDEVVHHLDGDKTNNDLSNLRLLARSDHARGHAKLPTLIPLDCRWCGAEFERQVRQVNHKRANGQTVFFCSRSCGTKHQHYIQRMGVG